MDRRGMAAVAVGALGLCAAAACSLGLSDTCSESETCATAPGGEDGDSGAIPTIMDGASDETSPEATACDPTLAPSIAPCVLRDDNGLFVASLEVVDAGADGSTGSAVEDAGDSAIDGSADVAPASAKDGAPDASLGDGTMLRPFATIGQALANLGEKTRIYVCSGVYPEQVTVTVPVAIYGGLDCAPSAGGRVWSYVGQAAQVISPSPAYALSVVGVSSGAVTIEDVSFQSPSATAPGASSIAALIAASSVNLMGVTLAAGQGADGAPGADGNATPNYQGLAPIGGAQNYTDTNSLVVAVAGGEGALNTCLLYGSSSGGDGGLGCAAGLGTPGAAVPPAPNLVPGQDGVPRGVALADGGVATLNDPGADGLAGEGGVAASADIYGTVSASGWIAQAGDDGEPGRPGQGGAGATDPLYGACSAPTSSVGGGGGGAGGCGGAGGQGGRGGGASIALASVGATVALQRCVLRSAAAGHGGAGGAGQDGQAGAVGGDVVIPIAPTHVPGQVGGNGAGGSGGGGGTGGISVGVLSQGGNVTWDIPTGQSIALGLSGSGGAPGAAGKHPTGAMSATGSDGNPGATGRAGTSAASLQVP